MRLPSSIYSQQEDSASIGQAGRLQSVEMTNDSWGWLGTGFIWKGSGISQPGVQASCVTRIFPMQFWNPFGGTGKYLMSQTPGAGRQWNLTKQILKMMPSCCS